MTNFNFYDNEPEVEEIGDDHEASTYLSIGDLMSGLLMFFALLFITALLQLQQAKEELMKQRRVVLGTLIEQLRGNNLKVEVNPETGDVSMKNEILFAEGSAKLKPEGKAFLNQFIPIYSQVIFSNSIFEEQITRVVLEGHTSSKGSDESNMQLSLLRSFTVYQYIFSKDINFATKNRLREKLLASGRGEVDSDQKRDAPEDRKVVFKIQFKTGESK